MAAIFFSERLVTIAEDDRVLEVGPGACPHPRADILLEKRFSTAAEMFRQRGHMPPLATEKAVVYFEGGKFPFNDKEFDYCICSHVLEHVEDVAFFCSELSRVAYRGYLEFPAVYYDYLYDFPEHVSLLNWENGVVNYMPKAVSGLERFKPVTGFFFSTLTQGYDAFIRSFKNAFFQGFEWEGRIICRRAENIAGLCPVVGGEQQGRAAVLVFSRDRALQLEGLLASLVLHCAEYNVLQPVVIYKCSDKRHQAQYDELALRYRRVRFCGETDFTAQVKTVLAGSQYVVFLVDDTIIVQDFSVREITGLLAGNPDVAGVSLRLGRNTVNCYPLDRRQELPKFTEEGNGYLSYVWPDADGDFSYPLEISSSCYRSSDILQVLGGDTFCSPNQLEGRLAAKAAALRWLSKTRLMCARHSLAFSIPVNIVQNEVNNRFAEQSGLTAEKLSGLFAAGNRLDVEYYDGFVPSGCHQVTELKLK